MVTQTVETQTETQADPSQTETQTETPVTAAGALGGTEPVVTERAAETPSEDAATVPQVSVSEPEKPEYMTRVDWEREKVDVATRAASDALELDRRRRQTENARAASQAKRDTEDRQELIDTAKAAFGAAGIYEVPEDALTTAVDRMVRKRSDQISVAALDTVDGAWDYLTAPAYGKQVELDDTFEGLAKRLGPKLQHLVDAIKPAIEAEARKGYIAESELPRRIDDAIAARAAKGREGQEELRRVEGMPASSVMSWQAYMNLSDAEKLAMPVEQRREIMAADALRRSQ